MDLMTVLIPLSTAWPDMGLRDAMALAGDLAKFVPEAAPLTAPWGKRASEWKAYVETLPTVKSEIDGNRKISAIKALRAVHFMGLVEAKVIIDYIMGGYSSTRDPSTFVINQ